MTLEPDESDHGAVNIIITQRLCLGTFEEQKPENLKHQKMGEEQREHLQAHICQQ